MLFNLRALLRAWAGIRSDRRPRLSRRAKLHKMAVQAETLENRLMLTPDIYVVPGVSTDQIDVSFNLTKQDTKFKNEIGVFVVDDATGAVDGKLPGTADYARAVMHSPDRHVLFTSGGHPGVTQDLTFAGGTFLAFYLVKKHSSALLLSHDHHTKFPNSPTVYFSSENQSRDHFDHARSVVLANGSTEYQWKDSKGGQDHEYDDAVYTITATVPTPAAPTVSLSHDTGTSASDRLTSDPAIGGAVAPNTVGLEAAFVTGSGTPTFQDITANLDGGTYALTAADLATLNGGALTDGTYRLLVRSRDASGRLSSNASLAFTLDTTVPTPTVTLSHDTGASSTDGLTTDPTVHGTVTDSHGIVTLEAAFDLGTTPVFHDITGKLAGGAFTLSAADLAVILGSVLIDGPYRLLVRAHDAAGNVSSAGALQFTLDSSVNAPTLALANDTGASNTDELTSDGTVQGTAADANGIASLEMAFDFGATPVFHDITGKLINGAFTLNPADLATVLGGSLVDGSYRVLVRARDAAGNVSATKALSFVLDTSVSVPSVSLVNDTGVSSTDRLTSDPTIQGTVADSNGVATVEVAFDLGTTPVFHDITNQVSNGAFALSAADLATILGSPLNDGTYQLLARTRDQAGNVSGDTALSFTFKLDTVASAPTVALANDTGTSSTDGLTSDPTIQGTVTDTNGIASVEAAFDLGSPLVFHDITGKLVNGSFTLSTADLATILGSPLIDGDYHLLVRAHDNAGNVSALASLIFTRDTTVNAPSIALANDTGASNTDRVTSDPTIQGTASDAHGIAALQAAFDLGTTLVFHDITAKLVDGAFTLSPADLSALLGLPLANGDYRLVVHAVDAAGNVSSDTALTFTLAPDSSIGAPTLSLANDTGSSNSDRVTSDPTVQGSVAPAANVVTLEAAFDVGTLPVFHDITGKLSNNAFTLNPADLAAVLGATLTDGDYRLLVRARDNSGDISGVTALTFTLDTSVTAPTVALANDTGASSTDRLTSDATIHGTAADSHGIVGLEAAFDLGANPAFQDLTPQLTNGAFTFSPSDLATLLGAPLVDGSYTLLVRVRDGAGNLSATTTLSFTLDTSVVGPSVSLANDTGDSNTDRLTSDPSVQGTAADLHGIARLEAAFDLGGTPVFHDVTSKLTNGTYVLNAIDLAAVLGTTLPDADYRLLVRVRDGAGNVSANTVLTFTLDTTVNVPGAVLANDTGNSDTDHLTFDSTVQGTAADLHGVTLLEAAFDLGTTPVFHDITGKLSNGVYTLTPGNLAGILGVNLADGHYRLLVRAYDSAGNVSNNAVLNFTLDTTVGPPTVALANDTGFSNSDGLTSDPTVQGTGTDTDGIATLEVAFDVGQSPVFHDLSNEFSNGTFTLSVADLTTALGGPLVDGAYRLLVRTRDIAGNLSANAALVITLDTVIAPPTLALATDTGVSNTDRVTSNPTVQGTIADIHGPIKLEAGFNFGGSTVFHDVSSRLVSGQFTLSAGDLASLLNFSMPNDHYNLVVRAHDAAGNVSTNNLTFTFDSTGPAITIDSPASGQLATHNITINGHVTDNLSGVALLEAAIDGGTFAPLSIGGEGAFSLTTTLPLDGTADGTHTIHLRATDNAGNVTVFNDFTFNLQSG